MQVNSQNCSANPFFLRVASFSKHSWPLQQKITHKVKERIGRIFRVCVQNIRCVHVLYEYYFREVDIVSVEGVLGKVFSDIADDFFHAALNDKYRQGNGLQNQKQHKIGEKKTSQNRLQCRISSDDGFMD